jgi:hypothetical protein
LAGRYERHFAAADETLVSQEFMKWYRALIRANAADTVGRLNAKLNSLRSILPSFIKVLEAAMKEAGQPMAA